MTSFYNLLKYAATGIASPSMTYFDKMRASTLMGGVVQTLTGQPPLSFKSDGSPLISWSMKGNGQQTGTPTPSAPIMPEMCGVLNENLAIIDSDSRTITNGYYYDVRLTNAIPAGTYELSFSIDSKTGTPYSGSIGRGTTSGYIADVVYVTIGNDIPVTITKTLTLTESACVWARFLRSPSPSTFSYSISKIRVEEGSTAYGYKLPLTNAGQTIPVYLGEVPTVRRVRKLVLTGTETWTAEGGSVSAQYFRYLFDTAETSITGIGVCSHFEYGAISSATTEDNIFAINYWIHAPTGNCIYMRYKTAADVDAFKTWLADEYSAGHPVTIWYVLATEQTSVVNEPLCKISTYADELSSEDASVTIPTAKGQNVLTVDTELQPSEMTIQYTG